MQFDVETVNQILGIDDAYKAPDRLLNLMLDDDRRVATFKNFLKVSTDLSFDWFHEYFEDEQAERKSKKQDFTPDSIAEPAAGTGGILITRWWQNCRTDPRSYWYQVEELSDRAIPFLIFNMAIRGMNGVVVQCDSLSREAKEAYFIRNDTDNFLAFSKIEKVPHSEALAKELNIKWT